MILCEHCNRLIKDLHKSWNRHRRHWCSVECWLQDKHKFVK
jgi:hypothetical protein